jgi:hypothetical protein
MPGLSGEQVETFLKQRFPRINSGTLKAVKTVFLHLMTRRPFVCLDPASYCWFFDDPAFTMQCLISLVCEDIRAGGSPPIYISAKPLGGVVGGDKWWVEIELEEWPTST